MRTNNYFNIPNKDQFTVAVNHINKNRALLPYVLNEKMGEFAMKSIAPLKDATTQEPRLYKLNILKNAFLNEKLALKSRIVKLNETELELAIKVTKAKSNDTDIICEAYYKVPLENYHTGHAS